MNRRQKIIISIIGIFLVSFALIGLTYGYFLTKITPNSDSKSISLETEDLELKYEDGNGSLSPAGMLYPGTKVNFLTTSGEVTDVKTFSVTNTGLGKVDKYAVILDEYYVYYTEDAYIDSETVIAAGTKTYFKNPEHFKLTITCTVYDTDDLNTSKGNCDEQFDGTLPGNNDILLYNSIDEGETHVYELSMEYIDSNTDQSADMNKTLSARVNIMAVNDTVDLEVSSTDTTAASYIEIEEVVNATSTSNETKETKASFLNEIDDSSTLRNLFNSSTTKSYIDKDGTYKILGLTPGDYKIKYYNASSTNTDAVEVKTIKIERGTTAGISDNVITITNNSRVFTMSIDSSSGVGTLIDMKDRYENPFEESTLAWNILNNAKDLSHEEMELGYAQYRIPITMPAVEPTMLYTDNGAGTESTKNYISTKTFTATNAAKYYITYGDTATYTTSYTITNEDGSSLQAVLVSTGYETLIGKYIVAYAGSTSSAAVSGSGKSSIYYVTNATATTIEYLTLNGGLASNEKYITYGDSYKFNASTGTYTLNNVQVVKYSDGYNALVGKYVVNIAGTNSSTAATSTNLSSIYLVTESSTETAMAYKTITKKTTTESYGSAESTLATTPDDYGTSYYFRGNVENNYLEFNNMCWRIVRIEGDGSVKITLAAQKVCSEITSDDAESAVIGYGMYGYSGNWDTTDYIDYENSNGTTSMKYKLEEWFTSNLISVKSKLKETQACKGDVDNVYSGSGNLLTEDQVLDIFTNHSSTFYYEAYVRIYGLGQTANATLMCNASGGKTSETQIFPLTADEVVFAGGKAGANNFTYYLRDNASSSEGYSWYTLSPSHLYDSWVHTAFVVTPSGNLTYGSIDGADYGFRPTVSLIAGTQFDSGDGTISKPYKIK